MKFTDYFHFDELDSTNRLELNKGTKEGDICLDFNSQISGLKYDMEIVFGKYDILIDIMISTKGSLFVKEIQKVNRLYMLDDGQYPEDSNMNKLHNRNTYETMYNDFIIPKINKNGFDDSIDEIRETLDDDYINELLKENFGSINELFHITLEKIFQ